jgi:hypothetical protein
MDNQESAKQPRKKVLATREVLHKIYTSDGKYRGRGRVETEYYYTDESPSDSSSESSPTTMGRNKTGQRAKTPTQPPPADETDNEKQPEQTITVLQDEKDDMSDVTPPNAIATATQDNPQSIGSDNSDAKPSATDVQQDDNPQEEADDDWMFQAGGNEETDNPSPAMTFVRGTTINEQGIFLDGTGIPVAAKCTVEAAAVLCEQFGYKMVKDDTQEPNLSKYWSNKDMARLVIDEASLQKTGELTRRGYIGTVLKVD